MKLNPVYKKELKLSVRNKKLPIIIVLYNAVLTAFSLMAFYATFGSGVYSGMMGYGRIVNYAAVLELYVAIAIMQIILVVFIAPALTAGSIAGERERQTLDILLTTKLTSGQIIRGKLLSSISDLILVVFSSIPVMAIVFSIGGVRIKDLCQLILLIVIIAILAGSIGIFMSAVFKKTMVATIATYSVILIFGLGYPLFVLLMNSIAEANAWTVDLGFLSYVCLLNPGISLGVMLLTQFSNGGIISELFTQFGVTNTWISEKWFWLSIVLQMAVSVVFLLMAQVVLNPIKKPKKGKIGKEKAEQKEKGKKEKKSKKTEETKKNETQENETVK